MKKLFIAFGICSLLFVLGAIPCFAELPSVYSVDLIETLDSSDGETYEWRENDMCSMPSISVPEYTIRYDANYSYVKGFRLYFYVDSQPSNFTFQCDFRGTELVDFSSCSVNYLMDNSSFDWIKFDMFGHINYSLVDNAGTSSEIYRPEFFYYRAHPLFEIKEYQSNSDVYPPNFYIEFTFEPTQYFLYYVNPNNMVFNNMNFVNYVDGLYKASPMYDDASENTFKQITKNLQMQFNSSFLSVVNNFVDATFLDDFNTHQAMSSVYAAIWGHFLTWPIIGSICIFSVAALSLSVLVSWLRRRIDH